MILFWLLTGILGVFVWRRHIGWAELLILCSWGLLAAAAPIGHTLVGWLTSLSVQLGHWL